MGNDIPLWAIAEHRKDVETMKAHELEDEIFELYADAMELADRLARAEVRTDSLAGIDVHVSKLGFWGLFSRPYREHRFVESWELGSCPALEIESIVLTADGQLYFNRNRPMAGGDEQIPVLEPAFLLREEELSTLRGAKAVRKLLTALESKHKA